MIQNSDQVMIEGMRGSLIGLWFSFRVTLYIYVALHSRAIVVAIPNLSYQAAQL